MKNEQKETPTLQKAYSATQTNDPTTAMLTIIWRQVKAIRFAQAKTAMDQDTVIYQDALFNTVRQEANAQNVTDPLQLVRELETKLQNA